MYDFDRDDPTFKEDLAASQDAVERVARWLRDRGNAVIVRPTFVRPEAKQMTEYSDDGDLEIIQRVEVKRRGFAFSSKEDYPYPTVFIDNCHTVENARPKPYGYVILNEAMTTALIVDCRTRSTWGKREVWDKKKGRNRCIYECMIDQVEVVQL